MLRSIRNIPIINALIRRFLLKSAEKINKIILHWRVSGKVKINFSDFSFFMHAQADDGIVDQLYYNNYIEKQDLLLFSRLAINSGTIFDIGANTGIYSIIAGLSNPEARIYSFEPNPVNIKRLKKNLWINRLENIQVIDKAMGAEAGVVSFAVPENNIISDTSSAVWEFSNSTYKGEISWKQIQVRQTTLDKFIFKEKIMNNVLLKIDVEGYEAEVLKGAGNFFSRYAPVIILESFLGPEEERFLNAFANENAYHPYLILQEGLLKMEGSFTKNPGGLNFLLSKKETSSAFTPYKDIELLVKEIQ